MSAADLEASFGTGDASFRAAGEREGLERLAVAFYEHMDTLPAAATIRAMHPRDLSLSIDKLATFLCGWLGGPRTYAERFGKITIPGAHAHLAIDEAERDAWMQCMALAVAEQPWTDAFKAYFLKAVAVPAERVRATSAARRAE
jgi:hemoglobin